MKKSLKNVLAGLLIVPALVLGVALLAPIADPVAAQSIQEGVNSTNTDSFVQKLDGDNGVFRDIVNTALYIIGAISVLMLIYGGIRYTLSAGQTANVEAAKNTILYAIIGIIVAVLAFAIVNFVLGSLIGN
jgi:Type IV secretion system pilin